VDNFPDSGGGFSNLDFKNEGSKSAQSHLINEIETDSIDLSRLDQTFLKGVTRLGQFLVLIHSLMLLDILGIALVRAYGLVQKML
jgi:hypothetical protein